MKPYDRQSARLETRSLIDDSQMPSNDIQTRYMDNLIKRKDFIDINNCDVIDNLNTYLPIMKN